MDFMPNNWEVSDLRKNFLKFQSLYPDITKTQKMLNSELHKIDNIIQEIEHNEDGETKDFFEKQYNEILRETFKKILELYKKTYEYR